MSQKIILIILAILMLISLIVAYVQWRKKNNSPLFNLV